MKSVVSGGLLIGVICSVWMIIMGVAGWYKDPVMMHAFWIVLLIQAGVLIWGLKRTAAEGATFGRLVLAGTLMSLVAGVLLFLFSYLYTTVIFPSYFEDLRLAQIEMLKSAGKTEEEIFREVELASMAQTPLIQAISGFFGTVVTGLVLSLIIAPFVRKKS